MKDEHLAINLSLLKILHGLRMLCLLLSGHESRRLNASNSPILVANPTSSNCLCLTLCVAQNPTTDHRASILIVLQVRLLRSHFVLKKEHRHLKKVKSANDKSSATPDQ
jgi:hypothetical protein